MVFNRCKSLNSKQIILIFSCLKHITVIVFIYVYMREFMCVYTFVQTSDVAQVPEEKAAHSSRAQLTRKPSDNGENIQTLFQENLSFPK